jgi:predicted transcriptional regulator
MEVKLMLKGIDLKVKRIMIGVQAKEIAEVLGVSKAFVTYMEKGTKKIPADKYIKWLEYLENK